MKKPMKKATSKRLTREQSAELKLLATQPDCAINTSDAQELLDWSGAKRGVFYRPVKQQLTLRLDADVDKDIVRVQLAGKFGLRGEHVTGWGRKEPRHA